VTTLRDDPRAAIVSHPPSDFRSFAGTRARRLHQVAYLLCGDWHLANDVVQETLAKAFRHWRRIQRADNPDAYVRRMLINEVHRHWRRRRDVTASAEVLDWRAPGPDPSDAVIRRADLLRALQRLPERQRATVVLRYLEGMSERETAKALGCSEGTVKSQAFRALAALRTVLH
jgi:RNA polymerase sigma-70 factor (sigma-E family)